MNAPARIQTDQRSQLAKLYAVVRLGISAFKAAGRNELFASPEGKAFVNAMFDLTECEQLYTLAQDVEHEMGRGS